MSKLFESILSNEKLKEDISHKGPRYIISSYISNKGREDWRIKEDEELDNALGIGHDKKLSLREVQEFLNNLPDLFKKFLDEHEKYERVIDHSVERPSIENDYWSPSVLIRFNFVDHYEGGSSCGGYQELHLMMDYESLADCLIGGE